eukprot:scaffold66518_cov52-Phaeocystis_antarctica.AAC.7
MALPTPLKRTDAHAIHERCWIPHHNPDTYLSSGAARPQALPGGARRRGRRPCPRLHAASLPVRPPALLQGLG